MRRVLLAVLMLVPVATAGIDNPEGPFTTHLYLHQDGPQDMVLSPQPPPESHSADPRRGLLTHSVCVSTPGQGFTGAMHHSWYAYVSPMPVRYDDGMRPSSDRGILADLHLDNVSLRFYVSTPAPAVVPDVVLRATLREGDDVSVDHAAMDAGRLVAQAQTEPALLSPALSGHPHVTHHEVDGQHVYGFALPLAGNATVPAAESFNLRVDLFVRNDACSEGYVMPDAVSLHTSPQLRPGLTLDARSPVRIERLAVTLEQDTLQFRAEVVPVFGSADAIIRDDAFHVTGPTTPVTVTSVSWNSGEGSRDGARVFPPPARHDGRLHALGAWAFDADDAAGGEYVLSMQVATQSGAVATAEVPFTLGARTTTCSVLPTGEPTCSVHGQSGKRSPLPVWALLGLLLVARRR